MEQDERLDLGGGLGEDKINLPTTKKRVKGTLEISNVQATQRLAQGRVKDVAPAVRHKTNKPPCRLFFSVLPVAYSFR